MTQRAKRSNRAGGGRAARWTRGIGLAIAAVGLACSGGSSDSADVAATPPPALPESYAGLYEVTGTTLVVGTDTKRRVTGKIVLEEGDAGYVSTFSLRTQIATQDGEVTADLNGKGEGSTTDGGLEGTAETQVILGAAPGLDPRFGFMPGRFGPRIESEWSAEPDGQDLVIHVTTQAAPGSAEAYPSTATEMRAVRTRGPSELKDEAKSAAAEDS